MYQMLQYWIPKCKTPTKVGFKIIDGRKVRFAKVSGEVID